MSGYEYDVFLSYSRGGTSGEWVHNHLADALQRCLNDERGSSQVFVDTQSVETGANWPSRLERVLNRSKVMVSVLSPLYFESQWCMTEIETMRRREELTGMLAQETRGIILPVVYSDGECFPKWVTERQAAFFKTWSYPQKSFQDTPEYLRFYDAVRRLAVEITALLKLVPEWADGWPVAHDPDVNGPRRAALPEL